MAEILSFCTVTESFMKACVLLIVTLGAACSLNANAADSAPASGQALFAKHCAACHGERGFATTRLEKKLGKERAMLEKRSDLDPALIKHVIRHGIGSMPWFTRVELSDADAAAIGTYLVKAN